MSLWSQLWVTMDQNLPGSVVGPLSSVPQKNAGELFEREYGRPAPF